MITLLYQGHVGPKAYQGGSTPRHRNCPWILHQAGCMLILTTCFGYWAWTTQKLSIKYSHFPRPHVLHTFKLNISKKHTIPSQSIKEVTILKSWARTDGVSKSLLSWLLTTITHPGRQWVRITFDWVRLWHIHFTEQNCEFWEGNMEAWWLEKDVKHMARWNHQGLKSFG